MYQDSYRLGALTLCPLIRENQLISLGCVSVNGVELRNDQLSFLPWFDTYDGNVFHRFVVDSIDQEEDRLTFNTTAYSDPEVMFMERRDCSGDVCLRQSWGGAPLTSRLRICLQAVTTTVDGLDFNGFKYWFEYESDRLAVHRLLDRQTWEIGGNLEGVSIVCRNLFDLAEKALSKNATYSTVGMNNWSGLLPGNLWARWSLLPAFDMQYSPQGTFLAWFDQVSLIRSVIETSNEEDWIRYVDCHYFENSKSFKTNPKTVVFNPTKLDQVDAINLWTRVYDSEQKKACAQFNIKNEAPPAITVSHNQWKDFHFDTTYESTLQTASELGADFVFVDPVWQNMETFRAAFDKAIPPEQQPNTVFEKFEHHNMCCTLDFEVSETAGGEERLKALCERANEKGLRIISWMSAHYHPLTALQNRKELGHGNFGIFAAKESGRHPDTGYASACWTVNLNTPVYDKIRDQILNVCERTGLSGFLWDSYSNLGWWQVDYSDGSMRTQHEKMGELYGILNNAGLYIQPEAVVSFSNHSCCGLHGGNVYKDDLLGYSYNTVIGLREKHLDEDPVLEIIRGERPLDLLFQCFAHKRIPTISTFEITDEIRNSNAFSAVKGLFEAYRNVRDDMVKRTVLKDGKGVIWESEDSGQKVLWCFKSQSMDTQCTDALSGDQLAGDHLEKNHVYVVG